MKMLKTLIQETAAPDPFQEEKPTDQEMLQRLIRKANAIYDYSQSLQKKYASIRSKPIPPFVVWTNNKPSHHEAVVVYHIRTKNSDGKNNMDPTYVYLDTSLATPSQIARVRRDEKLSTDLAETYRLLVAKIKRIQRKPATDKPGNMAKTFPVPGRPGYVITNPAAEFDKGVYVGKYEGYILPSNITPVQEALFLSFCKKHLGIDKSNMFVYAGIGTDPNAPRSFSTKPKTIAVVVINGGQMIWRTLGKSGGYVYFPDGKRYIVDQDIASYDHYAKHNTYMDIVKSVEHFKQLNAGKP